MLKMKKTLCKNISFLKDVFMIYVNFIITAITVSEKTQEAFLLYHLLYTVIKRVVSKVMSNNFL